MSLALTTTTELGAVNIMLGYINEQPVNSIGTTISEALLAQARLHETSREVQSSGLECNSIFNKELIADINGVFILPANILSIDASLPSKNVGYRENKLYDLDNDTFNFLPGELLRVDLIRFLDFEHLPEYVRRYITLLSAKEFVLTELGETAIYDRLIQERPPGALLKAKLEFMRNENKNKNNNIMTDSISVNQVVSRRYNPRNFQ